MSQPLLEYIKGRLNAEAPAPLYIQLKQAIEAAMTERLLTHGSILPSERKMSQTLELSRVTVVKALDAPYVADIYGWKIRRRKLHA